MSLMQLLSRVFPVAAFAAVALFAAAPISAWTGPTASPPNGNVSAPVNVGSTGQVKQGDLGVLGSLGVGTPSPAVKLDLTGGNLIVRNTWGSSDNVEVNGNQVWNTGTAAGLYFQWSNPGGAVNVGGQTGATNALNVYGAIWARDSVTSPQYCIGASCITSWTTGSVTGSGTVGTIPRFTATSALGNSSVTSDGVSATANGNFFITNAAYVSNGLDVKNASGAYTYITLHDDESPNGVKYIHANSNVIGFLSGAGSWLSYWDNSGNMQNTGGANFNGNVTVLGTSVCRADGTNCPAAAADTDTLATVTARGATTNTAVTFGAGPYTNDWFRVNGNGGIYWQAYGSGFNMSDATWIRSYGGAGLWMNGGNIGTDGCVTVGFGGAGCAAGSGQFSGTVTASSFLYASDRRLKENITPLTGSVNKLSQLSGVSFTWRPGTPNAGQEDIGVIAQDIERVVPQAVHTDAQGMKSVDYARLVPLLISAINDQQKEIDALKAQVAELVNAE